MIFFFLLIVSWPSLIGCWVICSSGLSQRTSHLSRSSTLCWCHCLFTCIFFVCVVVFVFDSEEAITVLVFPTTENTKKRFFYARRYEGQTVWNACICLLQSVSCFDFSQYNCWKNIPWTLNLLFLYQCHAQKALFKVPKTFLQINLYRC